MLGIGVLVGVAGICWPDPNLRLRRRLHRKYLGADHVRCRPAGARLLDAAVHNPLFAAVIPGGDLNKVNIPHGIMVGAGVVALVQVAQSSCAPQRAPVIRRGHRRCVAGWDSALRPIIAAA